MTCTECGNTVYSYNSCGIQKDSSEKMDGTNRKSSIRDSANNRILREICKKSSDYEFENRGDGRKKVVINYKQYGLQKLGKPEPIGKMEFEGAKFIHRFVQHFMPSHFHKVRYYGFYSFASSGLKAIVYASLTGQLPAAYQEPDKKSLIKKMLGQDPDQCSNCGAYGLVYGASPKFCGLPCVLQFWGCSIHDVVRSLFLHLFSFLITIQIHFCGLFHFCFE